MSLLVRLPRRKTLLELSALLLVVALVRYAIIGRGDPNANSLEPHRQPLPHREPPGEPLPCSRLPGADDVVVVVKTSTAELEDKLAVHLDTSLLCFPHHLIFSDFQQDYRGYPIHDALTSVSPSIKNNHPDFTLWRRLQKSGPDALNDAEIEHAADTMRDLDRWKWLPMINATLAMEPDRKWYVFLESDSHILWSNLLAWFHTLDPEQPHYLGAGKEMHELPYAVGGAGIILSRNTIRTVIDLFAKNKDVWESLTKDVGSGDEVVGGLIAATGTKLTRAWPILQNHNLGEMDYTTTSEERRLWCYPSVSYHGLTPGEMEELWKFEQNWIRDKPAQVITHSHVFQSYILPRLTARSGRADDWDNLSGTFERGTKTTSVDLCRELCVKHTDCVQFSYGNGKCEFSAAPRLGVSKKGVRARWMLARAEKWATDTQKCGPGEGGWIGNDGPGAAGR